MGASLVPLPPCAHPYDHLRDSDARRLCLRDSSLFKPPVRNAPGCRVTAHALLPHGTANERPNHPTGPFRTCITLKQTCVPKHSGGTRRHPLLAPLLTNTPVAASCSLPLGQSNQNRPGNSSWVVGSNFPGLSPIPSSDGDILISPSLQEIRESVCPPGEFNSLPASGRPLPADSVAGGGITLPLTETTLRVLSNCLPISNDHCAQSLLNERCLAANVAMTDFVEADDVLQVKREAHLLMLQSASSAAVPISSNDSNAESASRAGAVGQDLHAAGSVNSKNLDRRRFRHSGVRRSLLATLKCPSKPTANIVRPRSAERSSQQLARRHLILRQNLERARCCGQLTDVSCALLQEVLVQCLSNPDNMFLAQDWRQLLLSRGNGVSQSILECSTAASSATDSPTTGSPPCKNMGARPMSALSEKEHLFINSPISADDIVVDLDEASDVSDEHCHHRNMQAAHTQTSRISDFDSDILWQQDSERRELHYRRTRLRGRRLGMSCRSPFDAIQEVDHECDCEGVRRRELKPLRIAREFKDPDSGAVWANIVRDLNMPGFVEDFLKQINDHKQNVRNQAVLLQLLTHFVAEKQPQTHTHLETPAQQRTVRLEGVCVQPREAIWWDHDELSVEQRQLRNLVYGDQSFTPELNPGISRARRNDARELYKRLVRALDQRVPPQDRLLIQNGNWNKMTRVVSKRGTAASRRRWSRLEDSAVSNRTWIRASRSKQLFGKGSNLFPEPQYRTRLADLDPEHCYRGQ